MLKILVECKNFYTITRGLSTNYVLRNSKDPPVIENFGAKKEKRKIRETVVLITLVDQNDKILGLRPKSDSEKLAKKLNLSLERVFDTKFGKAYPAYKLTSSTDLLKTETKASSAKTLKKLPLNCRISDNDLKVKIHTVRKWIAKNCEVHIAISGTEGSSSSMKTIFNKMQEEMKAESRIVNIRNNEESIKFILLPTKQPTEKTESKKPSDSTEKTS